jgi:hypothetical protein
VFEPDKVRSAVIVPERRSAFAGVVPHSANMIRNIA